MTGELYLVQQESSKEAAMRKSKVSLTNEQRLAWEKLVGAGRESARKITRAQILLQADLGETDEEIAEALDIGVATVERARRRFASGGVQAAVERKPQPPRPQKRRLDGEG